MDLFTPEFKRLKAKNPPPNFNSIIDLHNFENKEESSPFSSSNSAFECIHKLSLKAPYEKQILGLKPCVDWHVFRFDHYPGFTVIQNPFVDGYQKYWVSRCLQDFPSDNKNVTNLSALGDLDSFHLWHNFSSLKKTTVSKDEPLRKLRWTTLGYHYNWTAKEYSEKHRADFPLDIQYLTQYFADCLDLGPFRAEAAIVNYYHVDSTLAGHTDHSELDHNAPLFSISFGQTAVFMLGGLTKEEKPMSLFLRSGDVCVMSGPSRLAYHAVPRILSFKDDYTDFSCFNFDVRDTLFKAISNHDTKTHDAYANSSMDPCSKHLPESQKRRNSDDGICSTPSKLSKIQASNLSVDMEKDKYTSVQSIDLPLCNNASFTMDSNLSFIDNLNKNIADRLLNMDWNPFKVYLELSRINLNVRQVFPIHSKFIPSDSFL